jgi:hypothetical protein
MITETGAVAEALDRLRAAGEDVTSGAIAALVVRGAEQRLVELADRADDAARRAALRERFLDRAFSGEGVDADAAHSASDAWVA